MKHLLVAAFLVASVLSAQHFVHAQTAPGSSAPTSPTGAPGTPPGSSVPTSPTGTPGTRPRPTLKLDTNRVPSAPSRSTLRPTNNTTPTFERFDGACLKQGSLIRLVGMNFKRLKDAGYKLTLKSSRGPKEQLKIISVRDRLITSRLNLRMPLQKGVTYQFELENSGRVLAGNGGSLRLEKCAETLSVQPSGATDSNDDALAREILVYLPFSDFNQALQAEVRSDLLAGGFTILQESSLQFLEALLFRLSAPAGSDLLEAIQNLQNAYPNAEVDFNHTSQLASGRRHYGYKLTGLPVPPGKCKQMVNAETRIGVIDGGANLKHSALKDMQHIHGARFGDGPVGIALPSQHGTAIVTQFKGNDTELGLFGLLPNSRIFIADVLGEASGVGNSYALIRALDWQAKRKAQIISISMEGPANRTVAAAFRKIEELGIFVIAAAGNGGLKGTPVYPAAYTSVISVTAVGPTRSIYSKANQGTFVDLAAPGLGIWVARKDTGASYQSGTSYAVPFVVGKAASILNALPKGQRLDRGRLLDALSNHAVDLGKTGADPVFGRGLMRMEEC